MPAVRQVDRLQHRALRLQHLQCVFHCGKNAGFDAFAHQRAGHTDANAAERR